jgi:hypothetical protein
LQQGLGRNGRDAGALQLQDLPPLPRHLLAHVLDLGSHMLKPHHVSSSPA